jgi:hypothetical protein
MKYLPNHILIILLVLAASGTYAQKPAQKITRAIYIAMNSGKDIEMSPPIDTLENGKEYEFRIRVSPDRKISQFLFQKGLAMQNDSVLVISARSPKDGGYDNAILRVIVTNLSGSRVYPYQKDFVVKVPEKTFPVLNNSKTNLVMVNDQVLLERNSSYSKDLLIDNHPFVTLYDNANSMKKIVVKQVTISLMEKEGKQYISKGDTISTEAIHELKKIKKPTPVYIRVEGQNGKSVKTVWSRIMVYNE